MGHRPLASSSVVVSSWFLFAVSSIDLRRSTSVFSCFPGSWWGPSSFCNNAQYAIHPADGPYHLPCRAPPLTHITCTVANVICMRSYIRHASGQHTKLMKADITPPPAANSHTDARRKSTYTTVFECCRFRMHQHAIEFHPRSVTSRTGIHARPHVPAHPDRLG